MFAYIQREKENYVGTKVEILDKEGKRNTGRPKFHKGRQN